MSNLYDIAAKRTEGTDAMLGAYRGKGLLVVNVASKCGLAPQYEGLEKLYQDKRAQGLKVLGFPPTTSWSRSPAASEISQFCSLDYEVHFTANPRPNREAADS